MLPPSTSLATPTVVVSSPCGIRREAASDLAPERPRAAAYTWKSREHQIRRRGDISAKRVSLAWIDEQHLTRTHLARLHPIVEVHSPTGHHHRDPERLAMPGHRLARLKLQAAYEPLPPL